MIIFRLKEYTILGGKYDGPKDMEDVPGALEVIGKSALAGAAVGGAVGYGLDKFTNYDSSLKQGASTGGKVGIVGGIGLKMLINTLHNPMTTVKYLEVDRAIRQQFGILRMSGITVGDSIEKRNKLDEKYAFNDSDILNYKINIVIQDNKFTMYLIGLTDDELKILNKSLDYYCKKYFGMNYTSTTLGSIKRENSYIVNIVFTNYQVISSFLNEISDALSLKINLLNNKAMVEVKTKEELLPTEKTYSVPLMDKTELAELFLRNGIVDLRRFFRFNKIDMLSCMIMDTIIDSLNRLNTNQLAKIAPVSREDLNNKFLETSFNNAGLVENLHYTVAKKGSPLNMYLSKGVLIISTLAKSAEGKSMDKIYLLEQKKFNNKNNVNNGLAAVYTYSVNSKSDLLLLLKKIVGTGIKPNIYVP